MQAIYSNKIPFYQKIAEIGKYLFFVEKKTSLFTQRKIFRFVQIKRMTTNKMWHITLLLPMKAQKALWEQEKMMVASIFSSSCNVFKSLLLQGTLNTEV